MAPNICFFDEPLQHSIPTCVKELLSEVGTSSETEGKEVVVRFTSCRVCFLSNVDLDVIEYLALLFDGYEASRVFRLETLPSILSLTS